MKVASIPWHFISDKLKLTWADVSWGFKNGWIDAASAVEYGVASLLENQEVKPEVVELAGLTASRLAEVPALLDRILGTSDRGGEAESRRRWTYLLLAWIYECRSDLKDPLRVIETLYADLGYPEELRPFVCYMPPEDGYEPSAHTQAENISRLMEKWKNYLDSFKTGD